MIDIYKHLNNFFKTEIQTIEVYNEFSLQHEIGIFLRSTFLNYKIQFERNISYFNIYGKFAKGGEIDICIFNPDKSEKYAIELKYPNNGRYPETMYNFVKDVKFMEELKEKGFTNTFCAVLVFDNNYITGREKSGIYKYFRNEYSVYGDIYKPTGLLKNIDYISINGKYDFTWNNINGQYGKYYIIKI